MDWLVEWSVLDGSVGGSVRHGLVGGYVMDWLVEWCVLDGSVGGSVLLGLVEVLY